MPHVDWWTGMLGAVLTLALLTFRHWWSAALHAAAAALLGILSAEIGARAGLAAAALYLAVAAGRLIFLAVRRARATLDPEERRMAETVLPALDPPQVRHLIDQGDWIEGRSGEVPTREGDPASHLFYLASGRARVASRGREIAVIEGPSLIGEVTILDESGASATVTLESAARFWCIDGQKLRLFRRENPALRRAVEQSFFGSLAAKLRATNQALAEPAEV